MEFLVRFTQVHDTFRVPELQALGEAENIPITVVSYSPDSPFCIITAPDAEAAARLARRAILTQSIYEYWGSGATLDELHEAVKQRSSHLWEQHATSSWKFNIDSYQGSRASSASRAELINTFRYMPLRGPIQMKNPDQEFTVFEEWPLHSPLLGIKDPARYHFGRYVGRGARDLVARFDLKKRPYISTTSMDSELALVTANMALAGPGKLFYDPFVGTGSFPIACSAFGAVTWGSDIDGRAVRGSGADSRAEAKRGLVGGEKTLRGNFRHYAIEGRLGDVFTSDLTNTPLRRLAFGTAPGPRARLFDGIVCDPPYGVREGLRVLGCRDPEARPWVVAAGQSKHADPNFVPPKKPYSFLAMLDDILCFAAETLVDGGRLSFWMPTANDEDLEIAVPAHPCLETVAVCVQPFNKWSRRLITYRKRADADVDAAELEAWRVRAERLHVGTTADELNPFRKGYFNKFQADAASSP